MSFMLMKSIIKSEFSWCTITMQRETEKSQKIIDAVINRRDAKIHCETAENIKSSESIILLRIDHHSHALQGPTAEVGDT